MKTNGTRTILIVVAAQLVILISSMALKPSADPAEIIPSSTDINLFSGKPTSNKGESSAINTISYTALNKEKVR